MSGVTLFGDETPERKSHWRLTPEEAIAVTNRMHYERKPVRRVFFPFGQLRVYYVDTFGSKGWVWSLGSHFSTSYDTEREAAEAALTTSIELLDEASSKLKSILKSMPVK